MAQPVRPPVTAHLKLRLRGGQASAAPPVGSTLGQYGVNMIDFINPFNEQTKDRGEEVLTVHIDVHSDRTMSWRLVGAATDELIRQAIGVDKGSGQPNSKPLEAKLSAKDLEAIAQAKMPDVNSDNLDSVQRMVAGTARSMGVELADDVQL